MYHNDKYFLDHCTITGKESRCHTKKSGSILVKDGDIICRGYNGPAKGLPDCSQRYKDDIALLEIMKNHGIDESSLKNIFNIKKCPGKILKRIPKEGEEFCYSLHAIKRCLLEAARLGFSTEGCSIYTNTSPSPCDDCFLSCVQSGIKEIVVIKNDINKSPLFWCLKYTDIIVREFKL